MTLQLPEDELLTYFDKLSNWGRWGPDDRLGTLNLVTEETRRAAAQLIRDGQAVSLSRDLDPKNPDPLGRGTVLQRYTQTDEGSHLLGRDDMRVEAVREYVGVVAHGSHTHLDGLAHFSWNGKNYNGFDASDTSSSSGARSLSVHQASTGVITRGVLLDIAALHGVPWLAPDHAITTAELESAAQRQAVSVRSGDALLIHTGHLARVAAEGVGPQHAQPGLVSTALPCLREWDISVMGMDGIQDIMPSGYAALDLWMPVHTVSLVALGLWLIDNMELSELAAVCDAKKRWDFFFTMLPWRIVGVTSSIVNPVALF